MLKKLFIFIGLFAFSLFLFSQIGKSYDDKTTHPALTDEMVDFYNASFSEKLTPEEKEWIVLGSINEDTPPRWINHFYDPVRNEGWKAENLGSISAPALRFVSRVFFDVNAEIVSSKRWARDEVLQSRYANYDGNNTWENGLRQYAKGDKQKAYYILGHILHLLEDATVPDHTRNDTHAHEGSFISGDGGSPYEDYGKNFSRQNLTTAEDLQKSGRKPVLLSSIDEYFDRLAKYSNGYFFSEHTINSPKYSNPKIIREKVYNNILLGYGKDFNGKDLPLVKIKETFDPKTASVLKEYSVNHPYIMDNYFSRLSQEAVLNGAGVIKLFQDEADKLSQGKITLPPEPQISWWQDMRSPLYGGIAMYNSSVTAVQAAATTIASTITNFFSSVLSAPLGFLSASVVSIPSAQPIAQQPVSQAPASAPTITSSEDVIVGAPLVPPTPTIPAPPIASEAIAGTTPFPLQSPVNSEPPQVVASVIIATSSTPITVKTTQTVQENSQTATGTAPRFSGGGWSSGVQYTTSDVVYLDEASATATATATSTASTTTDIIATSTDPTATSTERIIATTTEEVATATQEIIYPDSVVINEIAWMGTRASYTDEWIELYNKTNADIDLAGWALESRNKTLNIHLAGVIKANSYFLLERTASTTTDRQEDMIFTGAINNDGPNASLYLKNGSTTIDFVDFGYWPAGDNASRKTMERVSPYAEGNNYYNWKTYSEFSAGPFAKDAANNDIFGTPGAKNSATGWYIPAALSITRDTVWRKGHGPYFVPAVITITASSALTIESGVVVKFAKGARSGGGINVEGVLKADGTSQEPIIFTSSADDAADGIDSNQDATSSSPATGDWMNINFLNSKKPSSLKYTQVRYGGEGTNYNPNGWYPTYTGAVNIQNSSPDIYRSAFASNTAAAIYIKGDSHPKIIQSRIGETIAPTDFWSFAGGAGVRLIDASATAEIVGNTFENNTVAIASRSASTTPLTVRDNAFRGNKRNSEFYSAGWMNLDNSGNRDLDSKGGFHIAFHIIKGESVNLKSDGMPYIFDGGEFITVDEGGVLTIEPGTVLKNRGVTHTIRGTLKAQGAPEKPIVFTALADDSDGYDSNLSDAPPEEGAWKNIQFIGASSSDSVLDYVKIRYGGEGTNYNPNGWYPTYTGAVNIQNSSPRIANVTIENSRAVALNVKGLARPVITNSIIKNTVQATTGASMYYGYGIWLADADSSADIIGNRFENNEAAIRSESTSVDPLVVQDNIFFGNRENGIFSGYANFNLDNSGNRDDDNKSGFRISLNISGGQNKVLRSDTMPYIINWLQIAAGGELDIEPGSVLKMSSGSSLPVRGVLKARGAAGKPIVFTSLVDDSDGYDSDNSTVAPREGDWKNIQFIGASSSDSVLEYVKIKYGGSGIDTCPYAYLGGPCMRYEGVLLVDGASPIVLNSTLDRNLAVAVYIKGDARPVISNSTIINTKEAIVTPSSTIGGYGISIGAESSPTLADNIYGGNNQNVVYR